MQEERAARRVGRADFGENQWKEGWENDMMTRRRNIFGQAATTRHNLILRSKGLMRVLTTFTQPVTIPTARDILGILATCVTFVWSLGMMTDVTKRYLVPVRRGRRRGRREGDRGAKLKPTLRSPSPSLSLLSLSES